MEEPADRQSPSLGQLVARLGPTAGKRQRERRMTSPKGDPCKAIPLEDDAAGDIARTGRRERGALEDGNYGEFINHRLRALTHAILRSSLRPLRSRSPGIERKREEKRGEERMNRGNRGKTESEENSSGLARTARDVTRGEGDERSPPPLPHAREARRNLGEYSRPSVSRPAVPR